jgi:transposase
MAADTSFLSQKNISQASEILNQKNRIVSLENIIIDFKRNIFGRKSEKFDTNDSYFGLLFNESEIGIHDIPESEKTCNCGHKLRKIDEEFSEKLCFVPAKVYVEKHIQYKYVCKNCEGDERDEVGKIVVLAPIENQLLPKSIVTAELLTHVLVSKFMDHIPFYRMEKIFLRYGLEITRATLCNWTIGVYEKYNPLFGFFKKKLLESKLLGIDETVLQVHKFESLRIFLYTFFFSVELKYFYSTNIFRDRD